MNRLMVALAAALTATVAGAGVPPTPVPEPGIVELLAIGGVLALVVTVRNRRNR